VVAGTDARTGSAAAWGLDWEAVAGGEAGFEGDGAGPPCPDTRATHITTTPPARIGLVFTGPLVAHEPRSERTIGTIVPMVLVIYADSLRLSSNCW